MSAATTTPERSGIEANSSLVRKLLGGTSIAALIAAATIALWPASEADKARDDGEKFGAAVAQLQAADSTEEVDDALVELNAAVTDTREHAGDAVADQVDSQADALNRAADGFVGMHQSDDEFEADLYEYELDVAVDDLATNAEDFRTTGPEVQQAFWGGYEDGLNGDAS
jgi:hypothetical protein